MMNKLPVSDFEMEPSQVGVPSHYTGVAKTIWVARKMFNVDFYLTFGHVHVFMP